MSASLRSHGPRNSTAHAQRGARSRAGYVLVPIVLMLCVVAAIAYWLSLDAAMSGQRLTREAEADTAQTIARAGLDLARWRSAESACGGDLAIPETALGRHRFSATVTAGGATSTASFTADRDAWIQSSDPTANHGAEDPLEIEYAHGSATIHALYHFDLSAIPAGSRINAAVAWFHVDAAEPHPEGPLSVHRILADWAEGSVTWLRFAEQYQTASIDTIATQTTGDVWVPVQLTADVQAWVNGQPNFGILIRTPTDGVATRYGSREGAHPARLDVTIGNAPASPASFQATGTLASGTQRTLTSVEPAYQAVSHAARLLEPAAVDDGYIDPSNVDLSWGADTILKVEPGQLRSLLRFELEGLVPRGAQVRRASIRLSTRTRTTEGSIALYVLKRAWLEGTCTGSAGCTDGATWNSWNGSSTWSVAGGDFDAIPVAVANVPNSGEWIEWDVTGLARDWVSGARANDGVILVGSSGEGDFVSSDDADPSLRPRLELEFACACGDTCLVPQGSGALLLVVGDAAAPDAGDQALRARFEDWGYSVTLIDDGATAGEFTSSAASQDVVYVSGTISDAVLGTRLTGLAIGIVSAARTLYDELGLAAGASNSVGVELDVFDSTHVLTAPFMAGSVRVYERPMRLAQLTGTEAPGLQTLALAGGAGVLAVLEKDDLLTSGAAAAGRRVALPFDGTGGVAWDHVTSNGLLLVSQALSWAANLGTAVDLGPIAHWKLDDGSGAVAVDSEGGHDGAVLGPAWTIGRVGGGLAFDGSDDEIRVADDPTLHFSGAITMSAWMRTNTLSGSYRTIVNKGDSGTEQDYWFGIWNGELRFTFYAGGAYRRFGFAPGFAVGNWYHVAVSFDDPTNAVRLYVGGVEVASGTIAHSPPSGNYDLLIGKSNASGQVWNGALDDVRIYDRVLDPSEIAEIVAEAGAAPTCSGTFRDEFRAQTYSGSDGTRPWTGDWLEVNESDGPDRGDEVVLLDSLPSPPPQTYQLRVRNSGGGLGEGVVRILDLTGAGSATLSLLVRPYALDTASDYVAIELSKAGTAGPFTEIKRFAGPASPTTYAPFSQDISAYVSPNTAIRLRSSPTLGSSDIVWFDDVQVVCSP